MRWGGVAKSSIAIAFACVTLVIAAPPEPDPFPKASPESQGIPAAALRELSSIVSGYLDQDRVVGAELLIIKNRKTVLHEVFGWRDAEKKIPMSPGTLFNIRSMTKPVTGTAVLMLLDEGKLALSDPAAKYLPAFDTDKCRSITIEHLLTHRSGLPLTVLTAAGFKDATDLDDLATRAAQRGPEFPPGTAFQYSDAGSEVLAAIISKVSGMPVDQFVQKRILIPLGMRNSLTLIKKDDPLNERISSAYAGQTGAWVRYWSPADEPLYPFALGSQSLYSTPADYARFLAFWMDAGVVGKRRLLSSDVVRHALIPISKMDYASSIPNLDVFYGQMWMIYIDPAKSQDERVVLFGHGGSDGTVAWAWPKQDLMVLYFTQSRGGATGEEIEREIDRLLVHPRDTLQSTENDEKYTPYLGPYHLAGQSNSFERFAVITRDGALAFQLPGGMTRPLLPPDKESIWRFKHAPDKAGVAFDRSPSGDVDALWFFQYIDGKRQSSLPEAELGNVPDSYRPYVGIYSVRANILQTLEFKLYVDQERLTIKHPGGAVTRLHDPDVDGRWYLYEYPREYAVFTRDDAGQVTAVTVRTSDHLQKGEPPPEPELSLDQVRKYIGTYLDPEANLKLQVLLDNGRLAIKSPAVPALIELYPPNAAGRWALRLNPMVSISFDVSETGEVAGFTAHLPDGTTLKRPRIADADFPP